MSHKKETIDECLLLWLSYGAILAKAFSLFAIFLHNCVKEECKIRWESIVFPNNTSLSAGGAVFKEKFIFGGIRNKNSCNKIFLVLRPYIIWESFLEVRDIFITNRIAGDIEQKVHFQMLHPLKSKYN